MSHLANIISELIGDKARAEFAKAMKVHGGPSRETLRRIHDGDYVKLSTLREMSEALRLPRSKWLDIVVAWIQHEVGPDARHLVIEPRGGDGPLKDAADSIVAQAMMAFTALSPKHQREVLHAMQRKPVLESIAAFNKTYDALPLEKPAK